MIEIQQASDERTLAQLCALADETATICLIIAISPQTVVGPLYWGAMLNVLIVQDQAWYLLRGANRAILSDFLAKVIEHKRSFFIRDKVHSLSELSLADAAQYLINVQPCLLNLNTVERLKITAMPNHGEAIHIAEVNNQWR
jgi:hypothetical protein